MNIQFHARQKVAVTVAALLLALPLIHAQRPGGSPRAPAPRPAPAARPEPARPAPARPVMVNRDVHGSVRHVDTHVVERPEVHRDFAPHNVVAHRDVDVDIHGRRPWNDFAFHRHFDALPVGYLALNFGGVPYYYNDGIYYQPDNGGYQEVYPPVGAAIPQPPDGSIEVDSGGQVYYYAGGAFYVQQPDGTYVIAPTPIGAVVPELPPGAVQTSFNGTTAYQFNGINYEPVFVNGVTQYETFAP